MTDKATIDLNKMSDAQLFAIKSKDTQTSLKPRNRRTLIRSLEKKIENGEINPTDAQEISENYNENRVFFVNGRGGFSYFFSFVFGLRFSPKMSNLEFLFAILISHLFFYFLYFCFQLGHQLIKNLNKV
jgi:hypothetical protein